MFNVAHVMRGRAALLLLLLSLGLAACGFQLKGAFTLPFDTIYISLGENSPLGADLRRQIRANHAATLVDQAEGADAIFVQLSEDRDRVIASLNAQGRAREYQLRLRYTFMVVDAQGNRLIPPSQIILAREVTYDDNQILSKEQEEAFLWRDMERDLAQQILRRLSAVRVQATTTEDPS